MDGMRLRMLGPDDAHTAAELERVAYGGRSPRTHFGRELELNPVARYVGLESGGVLRGFAASWYQLDEAHVVNIAVAPGLRGQGYGRLLLHALLDLAMRYQMAVATLEVRPSNVAARELYRRYGFHEVGRRTRYYQDDGEDALILTTEELDSAAYRERFTRLARELERLLPGISPVLAEDALPVDLLEPGADGPAGTDEDRAATTQAGD